MRKKLILMIEKRKKKGRMNNYQFSLAAGLAPATIIRLMNGQACNMKTAEKVMQFLNLEIVERKK